jgi:hypothetical protein
MIKNLMTFVLLILFIIGCVPKAEHEKLKSELEQTQQELFDVQQKYDVLNNERIQLELQRNQTPYLSEEQAMQFIKDNYSFYEKGKKFRNVQLRRIADNSFKVSLETCISKGDFSESDFFWNAEVRTLTVYSNGKYDF